MAKLRRLLLGALVVLIVLTRWVLPWLGIHSGAPGECATGRCPLCPPGLWNHTDNKVLDPKGNQK